MLLGCIEAPPPLIPGIHSIATISRNGHFTLALIENLGEFAMLIEIHFKTVSLAVTPGFMKIGRVTVKESYGTVIKVYNFHRGPVLNLHAQKPFGNLVQTLNTPKPAGDYPGHSSATGVFAVSPAAKGRCLS
jgi:hypothetical protein